MDEITFSKELEALRMSKSLVRSFSQKLKKKNQRDQEEVEQVDDTRGGVSLRCLTLYGRGGGCKVGAETNESYGGTELQTGRRRSSCASEEAKLYNNSNSNDDVAAIDCFSYGMKEKFWKRNSRKMIWTNEQSPPQKSEIHVFLPDDILEMCLVRLPLTSLMNARLVCKKWRNLTTSQRFTQMRINGYQSPWVFVFGVVKDGYCSREIHALDVSHNQWHKLDASILKGRFLFSVTSVRDEVYIVGGCSSLTNFGKMDRSSFKTHKGVLLFTPENKSWQKMPSMKYARSSPILGACEINSDCLINKSQQNRQERRFNRSRFGVGSDVYEDPHRLSVRRQNEVMELTSNSFVRQRSDRVNVKGNRRFVLIAIGGLGSWDEPLDSGEIYDSSINKWVEIQRLPMDFGVACSAVICNRIFYVYSEHDKLAGYDVERGYWISIKTDSYPPHVHDYFPKLISSCGRLFMLSVSWCEGDGQIGRRNKAVRKLWELDLVYLTWLEVSTHPDAPMDWNAAFVADKNLIFGVEMFKIFGQVLDFLTVCDVEKGGMKWSHVTRNKMANDLDASSCMTKSIAVVHL
ncbi:F-box/kelch-repeat protein At5g42360-like [Impatiens glandulifera]|uniref:F-box/kelch-repeat protein At5g42360-like n=1 Tax=Impatiens glandulifera TaxID=253017 RepID=UPI001FB084F6|nr:F-box/kelch-repeat protein At5g42360-like [Impatiens glandulifera]XP_047322112.1 F-box/kelch-repeat protein At5g42360-like [Impatiens glandulifera]